MCAENLIPDRSKYLIMSKTIPSKMLHLCNYNTSFNDYES